MRCQEKLDLQRSCTAAWKSYAAYAREADIPTGGLPGLFKLYKGMPPIWRISETLAAAAHLRSAHLAAARALSLHLARHRC